MLFVAMLLFLAGGVAGRDAHAQQEAVQTLFPATEQPGEPPAAKPAVVPEDIKSILRAIEALDARLRVIESRLGTTTRPPALNETFERRFADMTRRMERMEQQLNRLQQMEQRLRRIETQKP